MNTLDKLKEMTTVVADTGDIESIKKYKPRDATTNPSLLFKAAQMPEYEDLVNSALDSCPFEHKCQPHTQMRPCLETLAVNFAEVILSIIPGRVSVEVDSMLSFDTANTILAAKRIISMFEDRGIDKKRILIKIASTWEGIKAAEQLEKEGIHCNLTLLFCFAQAIACAEAGVTLISPFVGRIMDWHKAKEGVDSIPPEEDPGVKSVTKIFNYFKYYGYDTEVMGASFRNAGEIKMLSGCDLLTISPQLLEELQNDQSDLPRMLDTSNPTNPECEKISLDEKSFRWMHNENAMAVEKLSEGIRNFTMDTNRLSSYIQEKRCNKA